MEERDLKEAWGPQRLSRARSLQWMDTLGHHRCRVIRQAWTAPPNSQVQQAGTLGFFGRKLSEGPRRGGTGTPASRAGDPVPERGV